MLSSLRRSVALSGSLTSLVAISRRIRPFAGAVYHMLAPHPHATPSEWFHAECEPKGTRFLILEKGFSSSSLLGFLIVAGYLGPVSPPRQRTPSLSNHARACAWGGRHEWLRPPRMWPKHIPLHESELTYYGYLVGLSVEKTLTHLSPSRCDPRLLPNFLSSLPCPKPEVSLSSEFRR